MEEHEEQRFRAATKQYARYMLKYASYRALWKPIVEVMAIIIVSMAILVGAHLILSGQTRLFGFQMTSRPLTPTSLLLFFAMLGGLADPARKTSNLFSSLLSGMAAANRIYAMLDREPEIRDPEHPVTIPAGSRELVFRDIEFCYRPEEPVLREINLTVPGGQTFAIVGHNGCGKSTLANLIPRFHDPQAGSVLLGNVDIRDVRLAELRNSIGVVAQNTILFNESIKENIRYGAPSATSAEVMEAAKKAHAHEFIMKVLEDGYDTVVGQGGNRLSGGQRQRIALARAILRDPALFILDEATSQIDAESERLIHRALAEFVRGRTTVMISHRFSTLELADRIVVMEAGRIVDCGTHNDLHGRCETYRKLHSTQTHWAA
jgi:ATP-binding cassette subfamily B protein/subfamily B ATP-binding cassette protein MsbA